MSRWGNLFGLRKPDKFSLDNLKFLHETLSRNAVITDKNKNLVIESLRQMSEVLIWGDQNNVPQIFDYFLEKHMLAHFLNILSQKTGQQVKVQLLQTLSILITGIKSETHLYYMLSNNHINELITHRFDFSNEEVLAYYISFLKSLSLKLNDNTLQFFFNDTEHDFPLYTEAVKFFNHSDNMVRTAVRNLTLNVYKVENEGMRTFILDRTTAPYFSNIVWFIADKCRTLDRLVTHSSSHTGSRRELAASVDELLDVFYYINDIFHLKMAPMNKVLASHLLENLLLPLFRGSLVGRVGTQERLSPGLALFLLAQVFHIFSHKRLIDTLGAALIHPNPTTYIHQMLKQTDSSKNLLSLGSGGSSNAYMVRDLKDSGATHSSLPSYDSGAQTTRLGGSSSKFHKRSFSVPSFAAFEEASPGPAPAGGANTPNPSPVASKRGSRTPGPKKPSTPLGHNPDESRKSAPRRLFGRKDNATAAAAVAAAGKADDEAKAKQQPGKRDASPVKVGLFASLLRKKEAQEKNVEAEEGERKEGEEEQKVEGSKPVVEEANEAKQNDDEGEDEKERKQSQPFPGIPLATDSMDDFAKKQNSRENVAGDDGADAPAEAGEGEQTQPEESDHRDNEGGEPAEDGGDDGDGTTEPAAEEAAEEPEGAEEPAAGDDGDDQVDGKEDDTAPVTLAELDRKSSAEVIREATERRERRTRARNRRMQGRVRAKAGAAGATAKPKPGSRKAAATDAGRNKYRDAILLMLEEGEDNTVLGAMALLYALLRNPSIDKPILQVSNLYPLRMSKAKQLLDALTAISPRQDGIDSPSLPFDSPEKHKAGDRLFASTSPPPQLVLLEELKPSKLAKDKAPASATTTTTTSASNVQQKAVEMKAGGGSATSEAGAHDGDEGGNDSGSNSMENSQEGSTEEHEEEESGDFEDSPETTESEEVEEEEEKKGRIRSAALEWMGEEEMERRSAQAEKEEADRLQEKRNRRKTDLLLQQQQQLTHKLPSSQDWTEKILSILVKSHTYRLITVQLAAILLKELVYCPDTDSNLTEGHIALLLEAYNAVVEKVKQRLNGSLGGIFLQLFEEEMSKYRQLNFEDIVTDSSPLLPVSATPFSDLPLSKRLPNGELEHTRRAIQGFFVLRELKYTLLRKKDFRLPLKERGHRRLRYSTKMSIKVGAGYPISDKEREKCIKGTMEKEEKPGAAPTAQKITWMLLPVDLQLAILHPVEGPNDPAPIIRHLMPLQNVDLQVDKVEGRKLQITHGRASYGLLLKSEDECQQAKAKLEKERNKLRDYKLKQIMQLFADTGDEREEDEAEEVEEEEEGDSCHDGGNASADANAIDSDGEHGSTIIHGSSHDDETNVSDGDDATAVVNTDDEGEQEQEQKQEKGNGEEKVAAVEGPKTEEDDCQSDLSESGPEVKKEKEDVRDEEDDGHHRQAAAAAAQERRPSVGHHDHVDKHPEPAVGADAKADADAKESEADVAPTTEEKEMAGAADAQPADESA